MGFSYDPQRTEHRQQNSRFRESRAPAASGKRTPDLSHHERHCTVCQHPERDAIEEAFIHWHNVYRIGHQHQLPSRSIYRHAHALGLFAVRAANLRFALELLIEKAETVNPTADSVIRAIRAYTCLTDAGEWIEPPAHVVVSSGTAMLNPRPAPLSPHQSLITTSPSLATSHQPLATVLLDTAGRTENDATH